VTTAPDDVPALLERFRANRREFTARLDRIAPERRTSAPSPDAHNAHAIVVLVAAWLDEAIDRIPRLMAGAPETEYDRTAFETAALSRAEPWTYDQANGAFRRAADRFDVMIAESSAAELTSEPPVICWLTFVAGDLIERHIGDLDRPLGTDTPHSSDR
jgi:hypothetical protein